MSGQQKRRSPRYLAELDVAIVDSRGETQYQSANVSRGGIFLRTENPKATRQLVRLRIDMPSIESVLELHGMVVHARTPTDAHEKGGEAGMGVEFFGFGGNPRQKWESFLRSLQLATPPSGSQPVAAQPPTGQQVPTMPHLAQFPPDQTPTPSAPQKSHTSSQRIALTRAVFPIPVDTVDQLYDILDGELSTGKMFLYTPAQIPVGDRVVARIIHPHSQEEFDLHGIVQHIHNPPQAQGITIELRPSTMARRDKLKEFIIRGLPEEDLSVDLLEES